MDVPNEKDEQWHGDDSEGDIVRAVGVDLRSIRFCELKNGGPYDGGVSAIIALAVRKVNGEYGEPVTMIMSPEDTIAMVSMCVDAASDGETDEWR